MAVTFGPVTRRRIPDGAVTADAQIGERRVRGGRRRRVLLVGELPASLRTELSERGAILAERKDLHQAFLALAECTFDVVVVDTVSDSMANDLVTAIKEGEFEHQRTVATLYGARGDAPFLRGIRPPTPDQLLAARARHAATPFVVTSGVDAYLVVVALPLATFPRDGRAHPLASAILGVESAELLLKVQPLA